MKHCAVCGEEHDGSPWFWVEYRHGGTGDLLVPGVWVCSSRCFHRVAALLRRLNDAVQDIGGMAYTEAKP